MLFRLFMVRPVQGDPLQLIQLRNIYISTIYYYLFIVLFFLYYYTFIAITTLISQKTHSRKSRVPVQLPDQTAGFPLCVFQFYLLKDLMFKRFNILKILCFKALYFVF